jgi:F-type H+-transporting ATPase subunit b
MSAHLFSSVVLASTEFQAKNTWLPEAAEVLWGTVAFIVVAGVLIWKAGPPIKKAMSDRTERIRREIDGAQRLKLEAEGAAAEIRRSKGDIAAERARILAEADLTAQRVLTDGRQRLEEEVAELEERTLEEIHASRSRLVDELQAQVASLAAEATERIVLANLDDATLEGLVEQYIARVGVRA